MKKRGFTVRRSGSKPANSSKTVEEIIKEAREAVKGGGYREQSLSIHGLICAKCGREFEPNERHLLTVHHKDGNPHNNPPDGSNWRTSASIVMMTSTAGDFSPTTSMKGNRRHLPGMPNCLRLVAAAFNPMSSTPRAHTRQLPCSRSSQ